MILLLKWKKIPLQKAKKKKKKEIKDTMWKVKNNSLLSEKIMTTPNAGENTKKLDCW